MAGSRGRSEPDLATRLETEPWRFDALQAARLITRIDGKPPKLQGRLKRDFPAGEVTNLTIADGSRQLEIAAFGLAQILPESYLDLLRGAGADAMRAFLAPFEDRLQRLRLDQQALLELEPGQDSAMADALVALLGLSTPHLPRAGAFLATAGLALRRPTSLDSIARFASYHLGLPVHPEPFAGRRIALPARSITRIGACGQSRALGVDTLLGRSAFNAAAGIKLAVGPVPLNRVAALSQGGDEYGQLMPVARFAAGAALAIEPVLTIEPSSITGMKLGAANLARTSFLGPWRRLEPPVISLRAQGRAA